MGAGGGNGRTRRTCRCRANWSSALTVELPREEGVRPRLVLDDGEQREMRDRIARINDRMSTGSAEQDSSELLRLRRMVRQFEIKMKTNVTTAIPTSSIVSSIVPIATMPSIARRRF